MQSSVAISIYYFSSYYCKKLNQRFFPLSAANQQHYIFFIMQGQNILKQQSTKSQNFNSYDLSNENMNLNVNEKKNNQFQLESISKNFDHFMQLLAKVNSNLKIETEEDLKSLDYLVIHKNHNLQAADIKLFYQMIPFFMPNIKHISSFSLNIKQIDLKNHQQIKKIICGSDCLFQKVWLKQLPNIQKIDFKDCKFLKQLIIEDCQSLKIINLSKSSIDQHNLQQILTQAPYLKHLDISGCKSISTLKIINQNYCLQKLNLSDTNLLSVELIKLQKLNQLNLQKCQYLQILQVRQCKMITSINLLSLIGIEQIQFQSLSNLKKFQLLFKGRTQYIKKGFRYVSVHYILKTIKSIRIINCQKLKKINVTYAQINKFELKNLPLIQTIHLILCRMNCIQFNTLQKVKKLSLYNSQINQNQFAKCAQFMPNIQQINLFLSLRETFNLSKLKLKKLDFRHMKVSKVQFNQLNLQKIEYINFRQIRNIRFLQFSQLKQLREIRITNSSLEFLSFKNLSKLQKVQILNQNQMKDILIVDCQKLQNISLKGNKHLERFVIQKLPQLKELVIFHSFKCDMKKLSQSINTFKNLQILSIINSQNLLQLPLYNLELLKQLDLGHCRKLQNIKLPNLTKLIYLKISSSSILTLSVEPQHTSYKYEQNNEEKHKQAQNQNLINIIFKKIPRSLLISKPFEKLKKIDLSYNNLNNIQIIGSITHQQLETLNLRQNQIVNLTPLKKLKKLPLNLYLALNKITMNSYNFNKKRYFSNLSIDNIKFSKTLNVLDQFKNFYQFSQKARNKMKIMEDVGAFENYNKQYHFIYL